MFIPGLVRLLTVSISINHEFHLSKSRKKINGLGVKIMKIPKIMEGKRRKKFEVGPKWIDGERRDIDSAMES